MGVTTNIAWTDHTFNPWWGCVNVSPGCDNCYAEAFAKRTGHDVWGKGGLRRVFGDKHWAEPLRWEGRVFCASMADVFEMNHQLDGERQRLFDLIDATPNLTWQLLTKRPENVNRLTPDRWLADWPEHVWLGTTVEDQTRANLRIPRLLSVEGVKVRFLSCEPLLGPVDLSLGYPFCDIGIEEVDEHIQWVIVGGESGPHHRPLNLDHARALRRQCAAFRIPFFFKQVGGRTPAAGGDELDGERIKEFPA
ncbi:MAG TPA: phage Gp37/Gp68 family protein [Acidimicrobiales bacterium]|nr:phage Gp37/Gp68 family protein [Acidimicrobiales bacterium]